MPTNELIPQRYGRPAFAQLGTARIYIHAHDEAYVRTRGWFEARLRATHPDTAGEAAGPDISARVGQLVTQYANWKAKEELWYGAFGLEPPRRGEEQKPLGRIISRRDRIQPSMTLAEEIDAIAERAVTEGVPYRQVVTTLKDALMKQAYCISGSIRKSATLLGICAGTVTTYNRRAKARHEKAAT